MTRTGVIAPLALADVARASGADYVEPPIVGNVIVPHGGGWRLADGVAGQRFGSFAILFPGSLRLSDPAEEARAATSAYLAEVVSLLGRLAEPGAKVVFGSGAARRIPEGVDRAAGEARFAEVLVEVRDAMEREGLQILLEPLHRGESDLVNTIGEAAAFLETHGIERVPIVADLFHIMREAEPFDALRTHAARIGHAHIADAERRFLGSGDWPWREFVETLRAVGYDGPVTLECVWGDDFGAELTASLAALRAV